MPLQELNVSTARNSIYLQGTFALVGTYASYFEALCTVTKRIVAKACLQIYMRTCLGETLQTMIGA